jgi:hypothetical protein
LASSARNASSASRADAEVGSEVGLSAAVEGDGCVTCV